MSDQNSEQHPLVKVDCALGADTTVKTLILAETILREHRCNYGRPDYSPRASLCLKDDGETCGIYLGQDATKCKYYNQCQCTACRIARGMLSP